MMKKIFALLLPGLLLFAGCNRKQAVMPEKVPVILDTDANNELDDQHAIAYLLCNQDVFQVEGITVNTTWNGGLIQNHYDEALRVMTLFNAQEKIPLKKGADGSFFEIEDHTGEAGFDGSDAVNFLVEKSEVERDQKLVIIAIGKLTNIALAVKKAPEIADRIHLVWLGSNYPDPGEYNLENDTSALSFLLDTDVEFDMVTVSYGKLTGTAAVKVSLQEIDSIMPGKGPHIDPPVRGRHGGLFNNFGDYSVSLFHHIKLEGDPPSRSLFDLCAVAVVKNGEWAETRKIPAPAYKDNAWVDRPQNQRTITLWENFNRDSIVSDLYRVLEHPVLDQE